MKRRLFIAISFPENTIDGIEREIAVLKLRFTEAVRFSLRENLHMTLIFLDDQDEEKIPKIREAMDAAVQGFSHEPLTLSEITYGPVGAHEPRMIWLNASASTSEYLGKLKNLLKTHLAKRGIQRDDEYPIYHGHMTLARFGNQAKETALPLLVHSESASKEYSVDLFVSEHTPEGSEYKVLYSIPRK